MHGVDLHCHSLASDGTLTPNELAALAAQAGLAGVALTDHDTLAGWEEMAAACAARQLQFVPGMELSAEHDGASVHLLAYWVDRNDAQLLAECARLHGERERRARVMVQRMQALGLDVSWDEVAAQAGSAPIGRPHMASVLIAHGLARDTNDAFDRWLGEDGTLYEQKQALEPVKAVELIRAAGGVAVLAHPALTFADAQAAENLLQQLVVAGLCGLEADHPSHERQSVEAWRQVALRHDLVLTAGSDFHGDHKAVRIGARNTSADVLQALREQSRGGTQW